MKNFVLKILTFGFILLVLSVPADYFITKGLFHSHERMIAVWNDIYNNVNLDNDLVVLGASTAWTSYNTRMMDSLLNMNTYNLGIDGHPWYMYKIRYDVYRQHTISPKYIVINLDILTFQDGVEDPYEREQFLPYIHKDRKLLNAIRIDKEISFADYFIPLCRYWGYYELKENGVDYYRKHKVYPWNVKGPYKGYLPNSTSPWDRASLERDSIHRIPFSQNVYDDMVSFIMKAKSEDIKVLLCRFPIYYELRDIEENMEDMEQIYSNISFETQTPLIDMSDIEIVYDSTYFYNPTHLNIFGSLPFTLEFCERFKEYTDGCK